MTSTIDLHMHSAASDGTDSPVHLVEKVRSAGIRVFALTDHDTVAGVEALAGRIPKDMTFLPGIEFSCRMASGSCHILGFGCDIHSAAFREALEEGAALRRAKLQKRLDFLEDEGVRLPEEELAALWLLPSVGKPHLAKLMVKYGYANDLDDAIQHTINRCHGGPGRIGAERAVRAILASGGVPVWAHPLGGEGEKPVGEEKFFTMLGELTSYGLRGLECYYSKYPLERCRWLTEIAAERGLLVSGGSDYHGTNKPIGLGALNADGMEVREDLLTVLGVFQASYNRDSNNRG